MKKDKNKADNPETADETVIEQVAADTEDVKEPVQETGQDAVLECDQAEIQGDAQDDIQPNPFAEELAAEKDRYIRLYAEYENFRKRSQKERENIYADVRADTIARFLPVYDNLKRALEQETADEAYRKGVEMIMTQLCEVLEKLGVTEIPAVGETFDPELHNAVMHVDDDEKGESEIVEEFERGFIMGNRVIRFSVVKVAN